MKKNRSLDKIIQLVVDKIPSAFPSNYRLASARNATLVHLMAQFGTGEQMKKILELDGSQDVLRMLDDFGFNALHYSCLAGNQETFDVIFDSLSE